MNNNKIIAEVDGQKKEFDICFAFISDQTNKGYVGYTDHSLDENGGEIVIVSTYDPNVGFEALGEVQTQEEWDIIHAFEEKIKNMD